MNNHKKSGSIDLGALLAQCELNHLRLLKLMPNLDSKAPLQLCYHPLPNRHLQLSLEIIHRAPHTLTIQIRQQTNQNKLAIARLQDMQDMKVQLYLDAKAVAVIECNGRPLLTKHAYCGYEGYIQHLLKKARYDSFLADLLTFWKNHAIAPKSALPDLASQANARTQNNPQHPAKKTYQDVRRSGS